MGRERQPSVLSRTILSSAGMATQGLGRFAYTWAVGRFLGADALGDVSALLALSLYAALLWPAGLAVTAARNLATPATAAASVSHLRRSFAVSAALITPVFTILAWALTRDGVAAITTGVLILAYSAYTFTRGVLLGQDRLLRAAVWDTIASGLTLLVVVGVIVGDWHWALMMPLAVGYLAFTWAAWPREAGVPASQADRRRWRAYTRAATWGAVATGGLLPATMVFVRAFDEPAAGYFGAALALATPLNMLSQALNQVLVPHFSRLSTENHDGLLASHRKLFLLTTAAFTIGFGGLIVLAPWLITLVFGASFAPGTAAMQALLGIVGVMSCMAAPAALLLAAGRQRTYATIWIAASVVGIATMAVASPFAGQWGALLGYGVGGAGGALAVIVAALRNRPPTT